MSEETLTSPIPTKQRAPITSRLQSPTSPFLLNSNDDQLERAQARAARAAAIRRKPIAPPPPQSDPCFSKDQILELYQNCIKLASENKINQKNTWELGLIDHLSEIIRVEAEDDVETNFQKASCTLEAGVKIYSLRVDSVHSEAYKVLGGINRAGQEDEQETIVEGSHIKNGKEEGRSKKDLERKLSPLSTLESSFEALNVKKFDAAFVVDPLFHQTSAQFDEGGVKGLLLNNLGVYGGCRVVFDSMEIPGKCMTCESRSDKLDTIDLSFARECVEQMVTNMPVKNEISPTLRNIVNQFDEDNRRPTDTFSVGQNTAGQVDSNDDNNADFDGDAFDNAGTWNFDHDDQSSVVDENPSYADQSFPSHHEENNYPNHESDTEEKYEEAYDFVFLGLGVSSNRNAWAGPDHWKFKKTKGSEDAPTAENGSPVAAKRPRHKKQTESDIDFTKFLDKDMPDIFAPPKNPKSLLLPANRAPCNTTLPEDCNYQPEDLVKLFLRPNIMCLGKRRIKPSDESRCENGDFEQMPSWDNESAFSGHFDDGNVHSDVEESNTLVSQPRQVNRIEVQYDKSSKQVDVHALKGTLWTHMQDSIGTPQIGHEREAEVSFKRVLASFPDDCQAAARAEAGFILFSKTLEDKKPVCIEETPHDKHMIETMETLVSSEKCDGIDNKGDDVKESPSRPSLFFIGGNETMEEIVEFKGDLYEDSEEVEEIRDLSGQELFMKAEMFIENFYNQLKIQREESWKRIHGFYQKSK
ncbi:hypothetical protein GIB67_026935 [Kingdonia uniflora]|uniref:Condensin complex subunit 2 n=1 Tax=Kingdonia uniflora TaxID=39325 RepID=A0A7J7P1N3_9MAGN|nr:hypothetical protein GIB67_026935 [Kingdonia uniflora]